MDEKKTRWWQTALTRNWGMKLLALFFSVVLWGVVMIETNPTRIHTVTEVEITLRNEAVLRESGLVLVQPTLPKITVTLEVRQSEYGNVNTQTVRAVADLGSITGTGSKTRVRLDVSSAVGSVRSVTPQYIELNVDAWEQAIVPVVVVVEGTTPQGYWKGTPSVAPTSIKVEGPRMELEGLKQAVVTLDVDQLTEPVQDMTSVTLVGEGGAPMTDSQLRTTESLVQVNLPIYPTARVAVRDVEHPENPYPVRILGAPAEGYELQSVEITPESLLLAGPADRLAEISGIDVKPILLNGEQGSMQVSLEPIVPDGLQLVEPQVKVTGNVVLGEIITQQEFSIGTVIIQGRSSEFDYEIDVDSVAAQLSDTYLHMQAIGTGSNMYAFVNVQNLQDGTYSLDLELYNKNDAEVVSITPGKATVTIKRRFGR